MNINGSTKILGVIGNPVEHSLSPLIHNFAYDLMGLNAVYLPMKVKKGYLEEALSGFCFVENAVGANVTIPFKEVAVKFMDVVSNDVREIGALNTIKRGDDKLIGYNTDWQGFLDSLKVNDVAEVKRVFVFGAGGAAKSIVYALLKSGCERICVTNRNPTRLELFLGMFRDERLYSCPWDEERIIDEIKECDLIVNCTSVGIDGTSKLPIDFRKVSKKVVVYDLIYSTETPFIKAAREWGLKTINGLDMLILQALYSINIWFGEMPDFKTVKDYVVENMGGG